ncbi:hypothetical protein BC835DRAFT_1360436 [Cytidiella melzeri]|nr:hypothetical protein BC835DRAFT_1360436 [Cytidiella melzeri]
MADLLHLDMVYCTLCDRYFPGSDARRHHIRVSTNHPKCDTCDRRFANKNSLRNHLVISPRHNWCAVCEKDFRTPAGLRVHIEYAAVHRDDSDDDSADEEIDDSSEGWEDELGLIKFPDEQQAGPDCHDDSESESDIVDYWTDDEHEGLEEELDDYDGFAPVPPSLQSSETDDSTAVSEDAKECCKDQAAAEPNLVTEPAVSSAVGVLVSCPLCLEASKATSATQCGHLFCTSCIKTALSKKKMCPVCREFASPKDLRKIFLPGCLMSSA